MCVSARINGDVNNVSAGQCVSASLGLSVEVFERGPVVASGSR